MGTGYNEQQSGFRAIYVRSNIQYDAGRFNPKSLSTAEYTLYSAVDKDIDKERSYDPLPGYYQITNSLYTYWLLLCSSVLKVC